jgi:transposase-like protein
MNEDQIPVVAGSIDNPVEDKPEDIGEPYHKDKKRMKKKIMEMYDQEYSLSQIAKVVGLKGRAPVRYHVVRELEKRKARKKSA